MSSIVERMGAHLSRQIAWLEKMIAELSDIEAELLTDATEGVLEKQQVHEEGLHELDAEFRALYEEWEQDETLREEDRAAMRVRAQRVAELTEELQGVFARGAATADARSASIAKSLVTLRRGKDLLAGYRPKDSRPARRMDRDV